MCDRMPGSLDYESRKAKAESGKAEAVAVQPTATAAAHRLRY